MRGFNFSWWFVGLAAATIAVLVIFFMPHEFSQLHEVDKLRNCPSRIYLSMLVRYDTPPVYEEEYRMQDVEGASASSYRIRAYAGKQITIDLPPRNEYDVSFLFGKLVSDGIWDITNKPPRGNTNAHYTVYVEQYIDCKHGDRTITFTDPHYLATMPEQFHIDLSKGVPKSVADLFMHPTSADPRYQTIVNDFRTFGSQQFRTSIARAQATIRSRH